MSNEVTARRVLAQRLTQEEVNDAINRLFACSYTRQDLQVLIAGIALISPDWTQRIWEHVVQNYTTLDLKDKLLHLLVRLNVSHVLSASTEFLSQAIKASLADAECLKYAITLTYNQALDDGPRGDDDITETFVAD